MSSSDEENEVLDLRKMEDVFACLEAVAMAQAVLSGVDPDTAQQLEKVTEALGALAMVVEQGELVQVVEKEVEVPGKGGQAPPASAPKEKGIDDLVEFAGSGKKKGGSGLPSDKEEGIIDILTGEKIR